MIDNQCRVTRCNITAIDREGNENEFLVREEKISEAGFQGIRYYVRTQSMNPYFCFGLDILFLQDGRLLQYMILNNDIPEVTGKGIIKALLKAISKDLERDIISSTNNGIKISISEGRVPDMERAWKKWHTELSNVDYLPNEDRYIFRFAPTT